jgi:hypothetical protein
VARQGVAGREPDLIERREIKAAWHSLQEAIDVYGHGVRARLEAFWVDGSHIPTTDIPDLMKVTAGVMRRFAAGKKRRK